MKLRTKIIEAWVTKWIDGEKAEFLLRPLTPKESTATLKQAEKVDWDKGQRFTDTDFYKFKMARVNKVIKDWKGVEDEEGNPLECNDKNREIVYAFNRDLIDALLDDSEKIMEQHIADEEALTKNS
jgi:hypothetical protein